MNKLTNTSTLVLLSIITITIGYVLQLNSAFYAVSTYDWYQGANPYEIALTDYDFAAWVLGTIAAFITIKVIKSIITRTLNSRVFKATANVAKAVSLNTEAMVINATNAVDRALQEQKKLNKED